MSKTQLKIILNDSSAIAEIAKDPEVVIEIKKAILDGISKRVAKAIEGEIATAIKTAVNEFTHPSKKNELFSASWYWNSPTLSSELRETVKGIVSRKVNDEIQEIIDKYEANAQYNEAFERRKKELEEYDLIVRYKSIYPKNYQLLLQNLLLNEGAEK